MTPTRILLALTLAGEVVGIALSALLILDARRDLSVIRARGVFNGRRLVAAGSLRTEWLRLLSLVLLAITTVLVGVVFWDTTGPIPPALLLARGTTALAIFAIVGQSLSVYALRRRLVDGYRLAGAPRPPTPPDVPSSADPTGDEHT